MDAFELAMDKPKSKRAFIIAGEKYTIEIVLEMADNESQSETVNLPLPMYGVLSN